MNKYLLLMPALTMLTARCIRRRRGKIGPQLAAEWLFDLWFCLLPVIALCLPLSRITLRIHENYAPRYLEFGKSAVLIYAALCVVFGCVQSFAHREFVIERTPLAPRRFPLVTALRALLWQAAVLALFILTFGYLWGVKNYNTISIEEIYFYLNMPLSGTARSFTLDLTSSVFRPALLCFAAFEAITLLRGPRPLRLTMARTRGMYLQLFPFRLSAGAALLLLATWFMILYNGADRFLHITEFFTSRVNLSTMIEQEYADPDDVRLTFPEQKRNLIHLCIESAETTNQDVANGGLFSVNYTPELTELARENVSFSHSEQLEGAAIAPACGWTIAGLVAQTAGLPLKLGLYDDQGMDNMGDQFASFLPGATTLGDILNAEGYRNVYMAGSDFTFGGRRQYFTQHGDYEIWDYLTAKELGRIPQDYYEGWGFEDQKLYEYAKEMLTELAAGDQPFNFSLLTVDTHAPGYVCAKCSPDDSGDSYARALRCSSAQAAEFIAWCQQQPFYENTVIVVTGDHASMTGPFYASSNTAYEKHSGDADRLVYNAFINAAAEPAQETGRLFTTLDFFPTTLAALGVTIEGERLGLGVNLFSGEKTLAEIYGYDVLFTELNKRSRFYDAQILFP